MKSRTAKSTKSNRGGARAGAGRKRKRELLAGPIEQLREAIEEITPHVGAALRELVTGVYREEATADGTVRVYRQPPNLGAIQEVLNRTLGKIPSHTSIGGDEQRPPIPLIIQSPCKHEPAAGLRKPEIEG
jgi:hypothetical protein